MQVVQVHHADGSLTQTFTYGTDDLRAALRRDLAGAAPTVRTKAIGRALSGAEPVRYVDAGHGTRVSVVDRTAAYRRNVTATRTADEHLEVRKYGHATRDAGPSFALPAGDGRTLDGYCVVWDVEYPISDRLGTFDERFVRGAFVDSLRVRKPIAQFEHGGHPLLGSLPLCVYDTVTEDTRGLHVVGRLADSWLIAPVTDAIRDGRIAGMSIRFAVTRETWSRDRTKRTITAANLYEAGPVVMPASPATSVGIRAVPTPGRRTTRTRAQRQAAALHLKGQR